MRTLVATLAILAGALVPAFSQTEPAQPLPIPTPKGAVVTTEMCVTRDQILSQIDGFLAIMMLSDGGGSSIDSSTIRDVLGTIQQVQFTEMKLAGKYATDDVLGQFEKGVGGKRLVYSIGQKAGSGMVVQATSDGGLFYAEVKPDVDKNGKVTSGRFRAVRTIGYPDLAKLAGLISDPTLMKTIFGQK